MAQIKLNATYGLTGTLPAVSGANLTTLNASNVSSGTLNTSRYVDNVGGITVADQWRITTDFSGSVQPIISNWEQIDGTAQGSMGSAMTNSSGVWTFPSTGFYLVSFDASAKLAGDTAYAYLIIDATVNNSSYTDIAYVFSFIQHTSSANTHQGFHCNSIVDVTDTANVKVRFGTNAANSSTTWNCNSGTNQVYATFLRLGDT